MPPGRAARFGSAPSVRSLARLLFKYNQGRARTKCQMSPRLVRTKLALRPPLAMARLVGARNFAT